MTVVTRLWHGHRAVFLAFLAAAAVTLFFAARLLFFALYWSDPAHRDQHPAGWMTPGYVARSWNVPRDDLAAVLGIAPSPGRPSTLAEIAAARGEPVATVIADVEAALAALRAGQAGQ
ncbi:hypothetical protein [Defluviimonas sp. SAOS-178_SWC]|uniref:hypothetical protein n=1 Tax=Defluviimonas sp. SAOS-178_SWC TaxID=3121287 RepID=UPI00322210EF